MQRAKQAKHMDGLQRLISAAYHRYGSLLIKVARKNTSLSDEAIEDLPEIRAALEKAHRMEDTLREYIESLEDPQSMSYSRSSSRGGRRTKRRRP